MTARPEVQRHRFNFGFKEDTVFFFHSLARRAIKFSVYTGREVSGKSNLAISNEIPYLCWAMVTMTDQCKKVC